MICPSCNHQLNATASVCACGARWVGPPPTESISAVPRLIYGMLALAVIVGAVAVQVALTIRSVYLSDLKWPWELFLTTSYLSKFILPVVALAALLAWRGVRRARSRPTEYGAGRLSRSCLVASLLVFVLDAGVLLARVPDMLENRRIKQEAYTRAMLHKVNDLITQYRQQYGAYPERLIDLQEMDPTIRPILDYWDHQLVYTPMSAEFASRGGPAPFQNFEVISRGRDGVLGTADDIVMRDGVILPRPSAETTADSSTAPPKK